MILFQFSGNCSSLNYVTFGQIRSQPLNLLFVIFTVLLRQCWKIPVTCSAVNEGPRLFFNKKDKIFKHREAKIKELWINSVWRKCSSSLLQGEILFLFNLSQSVPGLLKFCNSYELPFYNWSQLNNWLTNIRNSSFERFSMIDIDKKIYVRIFIQQQRELISPRIGIT